MQLWISSWVHFQENRGPAAGRCASVAVRTAARRLAAVWKPQPRCPQHGEEGGDGFLSCYFVHVETMLVKSFLFPLASTSSAKCSRDTKGKSGCLRGQGPSCPLVGCQEGSNRLGTRFPVSGGRQLRSPEISGALNHQEDLEPAEMHLGSKQDIFF